MALNEHDLFYNINSRKLEYTTYHAFAIGKGKTFVCGIIDTDTHILKVIVVIKHFKNSIDMTDIIDINFYKTVELILYNKIEEVVNINNIFRLWNKYKQINEFTNSNTNIFFNIPGGLKKFPYNTLKLVDYIIYNKIIKIEDIKYVSNSSSLHKKINDVYGKQIFNSY